MSLVAIDSRLRPTGPHRNNRPPKAKVKSGCRTCKIRKVKCDEGRPACHRCVSTGRVCDGYGIWGGGGNGGGHGHGQSHGYDYLSEDRKCLTTYGETVNGVPKVSISIASRIGGQQHRHYFKWFIHRTAPKLPGAFSSEFWDTLILQVSSTEPAVLHAVLALSSVHQREAVENNLWNMKGVDAPDEQEQFTLRQYSKAISHLQPHLAAENKTSVCVALVTCALFTCLEFIRGHYAIANTHLCSGLKLLGEAQSHASWKPHSQASSAIEDCIIETFLTLHVQSALLGQGIRNLPILPRHEEAELPTLLTFYSLHHARRHLDRLLRDITCLEARCLQRQDAPQVSVPDLEVSAEPLDHQRQALQAQLASWLRTYKATKARFRDGAAAPRDGFAFQLLRVYHIMACIMADACVWPPPAASAALDAHAHDFASIVGRAIGLWKGAASISRAVAWWEMDAVGSKGTEESGEREDEDTHRRSSIADMGWLPLLYYTALKCRVHRVRRQAVRLLPVRPHKEAVWDTEIAARIAQRVVELEEGDFYDGNGDDDAGDGDDFDLATPPSDRDLSRLPLLPEVRRLHDVQVVLPEDAAGRLVLVCRRWRGGGLGWEACVEEYDLPSRRWRSGGGVDR